MGDVWRDARTLSDLGLAMADWLEGRGLDWPGYDGPFGQEEVNGARHLIRYLAAMNRAGFVTVCSQPGREDRGNDGAHWRQKAFVRGHILPGPLLNGVLLASESAGLLVIRGTRRPVEPVPFTDRNGEPITGITTKLSRNQLPRDWHGIGRHALRELRDSTHLTIYDPEWGRDDRLWTALIGAIR